MISTWANSPTIIDERCILSIVGITGLVIYAAAGTVMRHQVNVERQLWIVDYVFGVLLCLVGLWLLVEPISIYISDNATYSDL